jgi:hypothetical protein
MVSSVRGVNGLGPSRFRIGHLASKAKAVSDHFYSNFVHDLSFGAMRLWTAASASELEAMQASFVIMMVSTCLDMPTPDLVKRRLKDTLHLDLSPAKWHLHT